MDIKIYTIKLKRSGYIRIYYYFFHASFRKRPLFFSHQFLLTSEEILSTFSYLASLSDVAS